MAALRGAGEGLDAELVSFGLEEEHQEGEARALRKRPLCDRADKQLGHDLEKPKAGDCAGRSAGPRQRLADTGGDARPSSRSRESAPPPEKTCRPREEGRLAGRSAARLVLARPPHGLEPPGGLARGHGVGLAATRQPCRGRPGDLREMTSSMVLLARAGRPGPSLGEGTHNAIGSGGNVRPRGGDAVEWEGLSHGDVCVEDHL